MIGFYLRWDAESLDPVLRQRFSASLGVGLSRPVGSVGEQGAILSSLGVNRTQAQAWRPGLFEGGRGRLLFTGYLDDPVALRRELTCASTDHGSLYAAALDRWGESTNTRLTGQFATIAWWPERRLVRCVRSPIVAPPLHFWQDRNSICVASTPRVLFASGELRAELDEQKLADSLYLNYAEGRRGWYKGVSRVETGWSVKFSPSAAVHKRYYDLAALPSVHFRRDDDYVDAANALLADGTRSALCGFERPAVSLSGGMDSQAVAVAAMEVLGQGRSLLGLTAVPSSRWVQFASPETLGDEWPNVVALANMYADLTIEPVHSDGLAFDHLQTAMFLLAGAAPRNVMNMPWIHALRARARSRGCDVLLMGQMGNNTLSFAGSGALPSWLARGRWARLLRELPYARDGRSLVRTFLGKAALPLLPDSWARSLDLARGIRTGAVPQWCPVQPAYAREMRLEERARDMSNTTAARLPRSTRAARIAAFGNAANELGDIRQALDLIHGVPSRDPTAYRPLVEFCLGLPDEQFLRNGENRRLARRMLRGRVPETVWREQKIATQAADWAEALSQNREALRAEFEGLAADSAMAHRFDLSRMMAALDRWKGDGPPAESDIEMLELAIPRALTAARFIRHVSGSNAV